MKLEVLLALCVVLEPSSGFTVTPTQRTLSRVGQLAATLQDEDDLARVSRRRGRGFFGEDREGVYEQADGVFDDAEDEDDDEWDDEDDEDYDDEEEYGLFSNVVIDNPLLDQIDPDGAADRFPELAADPRFWLDMALFICFLNYLSNVGPRNVFPEELFVNIPPM